MCINMKTIRFVDKEQDHSKVQHSLFFLLPNCYI